MLLCKFILMLCLTFAAMLFFGLASAKAEPLCIDRYCIEDNLDAFEATLSDLKIQGAAPYDPLQALDDPAYTRVSDDMFGTATEWIEIPNAWEVLAATFDLVYTQQDGALARLSLTNRLYDVTRNECELHFVSIAEQIEGKFGPFSANKRWAEWSRLLSERTFGISSEYAVYKDGRDDTYSTVVRASDTHDVSVETSYENKNGYVACISRIDIEPVFEPASE